MAWMYVLHTYKYYDKKCIKYLLTITYIVQNKLFIFKFCRSSSSRHSARSKDLSDNKKNTNEQRRHKQDRHSSKKKSKSKHKSRRR